MTSARVFSALLVVLGTIALSAGRGSAEVVSTIACTPSPMAIDYGQLIECEINPVGDMDTFAFSGTAGDQIVITLLGKTLDSGPCATLINPNGGVVVPEQCNVFADTHFVMIRTVLTVTGTYSVVINEHANNELNQYLLAVVRESPPDPTPPPTEVIPTVVCTPSPMAIDYGQLIECEINPVGDMDTFTFSGTAHDQIVIVLHGKSLDSGPCATLINPNGAVIVPEQCNVFADTHFVMIRTVLTVTGTYSVVINEHANNELNRYLFAVLRESNSALFAQAAVTVTAPSDATFGQSGLTATASGGSGTGAYSFNAAGSTACSVAASTGAITVTSGTGTCSITATRAGDADYKASAASAPATVTIHKADTTTTLTSSDANNTTVFGESVTFTATVAVVDPGSGTPTGSVGFLDGATSLGTVALAGLNASLTTSTLSVSGSPHSITTKYLGDTNFNVSTSAVISHTVDTVDRIAFAKARIASAGAIVAALPPSQVTTPGNKTAFGNFLKEAIGQLQNGNVAAAIQKLNMAIERTDGCALRMAVDGNGAGRDWITSCAAQIEVYNLLNGALNALIP